MRPKGVVVVWPIMGLNLDSHYQCVRVRQTHKTEILCSTSFPKRIMITTGVTRCSIKIEFLDSLLLKRVLMWHKINLREFGNGIHVESINEFKDVFPSCINRKPRLPAKSKQNLSRLLVLNATIATKIGSIFPCCAWFHMCSMNPLLILIFL